MLKTLKHFLAKNHGAVVSYVLWLSFVFVVFRYIGTEEHSDDHELQTDGQFDARCHEDNTVRCENGGLLARTDVGFVCECTRDYGGESCTVKSSRPALFSWLARVIGSLPSTAAAVDDTNYDRHSGEITGWWSVVWPFTSDRQKLKNSYTFYQNKMKRLSAMMAYTTVNKQRTGSATKNFTRILPPARPLHCAALQLYPPLSVLYDRIFQRDANQFLPDERRRNLLFHTFYQYFVLQFFDADFNPSVSASQLYGADKYTKRRLRSFSSGKLKTEYLNNEHYPPVLASVKGVKMVYPDVKLYPNAEWSYRIHMKTNQKQKLKWAMGHPLLSMNPMLFAMSTLWVREHNRVCDLLAKEYTLWTDGQIYHIAKKIVIGEMMGIMMNDIITVHTGSSFPIKLSPELYHDHLENISNFDTPIELLLVTMWPSSLPEHFRNTSIDSMLFSNNSQVFDHGMSDTIKFMINQEMSMITHNNDGTATERLTRLMLKLSRSNSLQNFNDYRRQLGLRAYKTFSDLTGNRKVVNKLQALYGNVENVELLPGMLTEMNVNGNSPTATILANSFIVNAILTNSLTSKELWTPSTFGGDIGFDIVKSANIMKLICNNLDNNCDGLSVKLYAR